MRCAVLFSGGKDSTYAAYLAKKSGNELCCLISIISKNPESYMFHTPSISKVVSQAEVMDIPIVLQETQGKKEEELKDLKKAIKKAIKNFNFDSIITGAVESNYQKDRIEKICKELDLNCLNPLWKKDQIELLKELIKNNFRVIIVGVFAYPLDKTYLGQEIDEKFIKNVKILKEKYKINPAGEGGEFESFVLDCPLFSRPLKIKKKNIQGQKNSWKMEIELY
jgi:diphthine-ammonia ligase